jgi:DNA-binding CsgD family transcriptional regulator
MGDDPGRAELAAVTVTLLHTALRPAQAQALGDREVTGVGGPAEEAALRLSLSQLLALSNGARVRENRRALALAGLAPDLRARHLGWLTYNLASGGWIAEAELVADDALEAARRAGDLEARVMATLGAVVTDTVRGTLGQALQRVHELDRAVAAAGDLPFVWLVDIHHANVLSRLGRSQEALAMLAAGVAHGRRTRNGFLIDSWAQRGSILRFEAGQLSDARMEAESSPTMVAQALAGSNAGAGGLLTTAQVAFHTGDGRRLRHAATAATQLYEHGSPAIRRIAAWILMLAALHRGDAAEAAGRLGDDELPYAAPTLPFDLSYQPTVARVAMAAGEHHLAARALEVAETFAAANPDVPVVVAAAALTRGIVGRSTPDLVDAARALRGTQRPLLFAQASEQAGLALCAADGHDAGIPFLRDALAGYLETEADADARRVSRTLRGFGIRPRSPARRRSRLSPDGLTRSERRVALLVAGGATNSAAAEQLFLSPHTVSAHLRRTFAKLGVNSRVELARLIHESTRESTGSPDE